MIGLMGENVNLFNGEHFTFQVPLAGYPAAAIGAQTVVPMQNSQRLRIVGASVQSVGPPLGLERILITVGSTPLIPARSSADPAVAAVGLDLAAWTLRQWKAPVDGVIAEVNEDVAVTIFGPGGAVEPLIIIFFCTAVADDEGPANRGVEPRPEPIDVRVVT